MNRLDFQALADVRIEEAIALLGLPVPMPDGAYYLAGYAVECALKACIAKEFGQHEWPDKQFVNRCHTHDLAELARLADLEGDLKVNAAANPILENHWFTVLEWTEQSRYERYSLAEARAIVDAVADNTNGVLPWIKARW